MITYCLLWGLVGLGIFTGTYPILYALIMKGYNIACREDKSLKRGLEFVVEIDYHKDTVKFFNKIEVVGFVGAAILAITPIVSVIITAIMLKEKVTPSDLAIADIYVLSLLGVITLPYVLRFVIDICKNLKMNHKTGKSEKIEELEEQIKALKDKIGG